MKTKLDYYLCKLLKKCRLRAIIGSNVHPTTKIYSGCHIVDCSIGKYSDIGYDCRIYATDIGAFCSFGTGVTAGGSMHTVNWVSTSTAFNADQDRRRKKFSLHPFSAQKRTRIGHDVWVADSVLIKGGVVIGNGAVIGMGAVVTKDVPPYEIWAGNPAHCIGKRFDDDTIAKLQALQWWEWDDEKLRKMAVYIQSPAEFIEHAQLSQTVTPKQD